MPHQPPRPCRQRGCPRVTTASHGHCDEHVGLAQSLADRARGSSARRGYDRRWRKLRDAYIAEHPLCRHCQERGIVTAAAEVDHIEPHRGDIALLLDWDNLQALCAPCHSAKTAREDGGFGNPIGGWKSSRPLSR